MAYFGRQLTVTHVVSSRPRVARPEAVGEPASASGGKTGDLDLQNILTLVPAEAIGPFVTFKDSAPAGIAPLTWSWILFVICLLIGIFIRLTASAPPGGFNPTRGNAVMALVTAMAFFIWAHATTDSNQLIAVFHGTFAGLAAMVFGVIAPKLVPSTPRPANS